MEINQKKKIIIISVSFILFLLIVISILLIRHQKGGSIFEKKQAETVFVPEFLNEEEKTSLGIPAKYDIQVLNRDENGKLKVYRVIREGEDPVNPNAIDEIN